MSFCNIVRGCTQILWKLAKRPVQCRNNLAVLAVLWELQKGPLGTQGNSRRKIFLFSD